MSAKRVTSRFAELAGLDYDYVEEAIGAVPTPQAPYPGQPPVADAIKPDSMPGVETTPEVDGPKKFWLVFPAHENSTIQDVLYHVTMKELCNIIRGGPQEEDAQLQLFADDKEEEANVAAQARLGDNSKPPADQGSDMGTPTSPGTGMSPSMGEALNQEVPVKKGEGPHTGTDAKVGQIDFQNTDSCPAMPNTELKFPETEKVEVPSEVSSAVKSAIKRATSDLERAQKRATLDNRMGDIRPADVDYYINLINAYDKISGLLKDGSGEALKQLQIFIPSLPNWVTKEFPADLTKFVATGGKKPSLKDRFKEIKSYKSREM